MTIDSSHARSTGRAAPALGDFFAQVLSDRDGFVAEVAAGDGLAAAPPSGAVRARTFVDPFDPARRHTVDSLETPR